MGHDRLYNWTRYWYPRGMMPLSLGDSFLADPTDDFLRYLNKEVVPFRALLEVPCLALIGEPGIGKSVEILSACRTTARLLEGTDHLARHLDLKEYGDDTRLCRDTFDSRMFEEWRSGSHNLHLFLDSFDECRLHEPAIASVLLRELRQCPRDRLFLRVGCRSADWPASFEGGLSELWPGDTMKVYHLAQLTRADVRAAASENGLDPDDFLCEVFERDASAFASKPITLRFLLKLRVDKRPLPGTQEGLYLEGCRHLCDEASPYRQETPGSVKVLLEERLRLAARIAYVMAFANRAAVWTGLETEADPRSDISLSELCGPGLPGDGLAAKSAIEEILNTGLYTSHGPHRMGWAHQSYGEFPAAWCMKQSNMPVKQMIHLLSVPDDPERRPAPQLAEISAWLAGMDAGVRQHLTTTSPDILLRSDLRLVSFDEKEGLVAALLDRFSRVRLSDMNVDRDDYRGLDHPRLAQQLLPHIKGGDRGWLVRRVAIDIAEACKLREAQEQLLAVALDETDYYYTRVQAAYALTRIADKSVRDRLRPLAIGKAGDDPDDELRGCALRALWPDHLETEEVLALISEPRRHNFTGAYAGFLADFARSLPVADIPAALDWVGQHKCQRLGHALERFADTILLRRLGTCRLPRRYGASCSGNVGPAQGVSPHGERV